MTVANIIIIFILQSGSIITEIERQGCQKNTGVTYLLHDWVCERFQVYATLIREIVKHIGRPHRFWPCGTTNHFNFKHLSHKQ